MAELGTCETLDLWPSNRPRYDNANGTENHNKWVPSIFVSPPNPPYVASLTSTTVEMKPGMSHLLIAYDDLVSRPGSVLELPTTLADRLVSSYLLASTPEYSEDPEVGTATVPVDGEKTTRELIADLQCEQSLMQYLQDIASVTRTGTSSAPEVAEPAGVSTVTIIFGADSKTYTCGDTLDISPWQCQSLDTKPSLCYDEDETWLEDEQGLVCTMM